MSWQSDSHAPATWKVLSAFAAVYLIWGSTYLAIRFAIETLPPFSMAAVRFLVAGSVLYVLARRRADPPTAAEWRAGILIGALLLGGGNGGVVWAQQWVPSGLAALVVATVSIVMVLIDWLFAGGPRPRTGLMVGLFWGLGGVALLVSSNELGAGSRQGLFGAFALLGATVAWASGSIYARSAPAPRSPWLATAMTMLGGGAVLAIMASLSGELATVDVAAFSGKSILALAYLIVFGALVAYTAYIWLLRVSTPARVSTYAYVNPVVAVILGWLFAGERLDLRAGIAMFVILSAVVVVTFKGGERSKAPSTSRSTAV